LRHRHRAARRGAAQPGLVARADSRVERRRLRAIRAVTQPLGQLQGRRRSTIDIGSRVGRHGERDVEGERGEQSDLIIWSSSVRARPAPQVCIGVRGRLWGSAIPFRPSFPTSTCRRTALLRCRLTLGHRRRISCGGAPTMNEPGYFLRSRFRVSVRTFCDLDA